LKNLTPKYAPVTIAQAITGHPLGSPPATRMKNAPMLAAERRPGADAHQQSAHETPHDELAFGS